MPVKTPNRKTTTSVKSTNPARSFEAPVTHFTPQQQKIRLIFLGAFLALWVVGVCVRLVVLQVVQYGRYSQLAMRQQQKSVDISPRRGVIYDRNMNELAMTIGTDSAYAVPDKILDKAAAAEQLGAALEQDPREILNKMESSHSFIWLARKMDTATSTKIHALNLPGVFYERESRRYYPNGELAASALGFVGTDDQGLGGVEKSFEERLKGKAGKLMVSVDARQKTLDSNERQPQPGDNLVLTLDEKIQYIAERELERAMATTKAESGIVIVQDPHTGEILALAARPTFNPNDFRNSEPSVLKNHAVSDIYEPGSTFKIVTIAAALEEKLTTPDELIDCQMGSINIFGRVIHDDTPHGVLSVSQIMQHSSDVGAIKLGIRLGERRFDQYIRAFGFGAKTGVELPGETRGITKPVERWQKSSIGSISMGQEVGVNALQMVGLVSTIANDGVYMPPRILRGAIASRTGTDASVMNVGFTPGAAKRVISTTTSAEVKRMLEETVLYGTGRKAILDGYTSAGKTGTAQKVDPETGTYSKWKHIASFSGFAPVNKPDVTVYVVMDSPVGAHHGADVAAPVWARITQQVLAYRNVPHDTEVNSVLRMQLRASVKPEDLVDGTDDRLGDEYIATDAEGTSNSSTSTVVEAPATATSMMRSGTSKHGKAHVIAASFHPANVVRVAEVNTESQRAMPALQPLPSMPKTSGTVIMDVGNGPLVPKFVGKSVRQAMESAQLAGIEIDVIGSGIAVEQMPAAGQRIPPGMRVSVRFAR